MADTNKKYLDLGGLQSYDAKLKAAIDSKDAAALASAKEYAKTYADGLATNYDAAGAAATAEASAKAYTDTEVGKANAAAAAAQTQADKGVADAATAKAAADKAQGEVDALESLVGTLPEGTQATSVVDYVNKKTEGIATDAALGELQAQLSAAQDAIDAIEADYLVEADKTALQGGIDANASAIAEVKEDVDAFLAAAEVGEAAVDTLKEIQTYITTDGEAAAKMTSDIAANAENITKEAERADAAEKALGVRIDGVEGDVAALEAKFGEGEGSVADMIADAVKAEEDARKAADTTLEGKITAAQTAAETAQGEVDALEGVVAELTTTVGTKAAQTALDAAVERVTTAEGKITTLEGASHTHANKADLDGITAALIADWNDAVAKEHEHGNKAVLDGITSTLVANWNAAEANAKAYTDTEIAKFVAISGTEIDALFA